MRLEFRASILVLVPASKPGVISRRIGAEACVRVPVARRIHDGAAELSSIAFTVDGIEPSFPNAVAPVLHALAVVV